jgi:uncharacterized protein
MDEPDARGLPQSIPIFPLDGAVLFPGEYLPLNIFEERYRNMVADALMGARLIGMVQPREAAEYASMAQAPVYLVGCVGRIKEHRETEDGRHLIVLEGVSRFRIDRELNGEQGLDRGYRRVEVSYQEFSEDREGSGTLGGGRDHIVQRLKAFLGQTAADADWAAIDDLPDERLVHTLAMTLPFPSVERQALLEAPTLRQRAEVLSALIALSGEPGPDPSQPLAH